MGLVKLMGRQSGFIALYASLASRDVSLSLVTLYYSEVTTLRDLDSDWTLLVSKFMILSLPSSTLPASLFQVNVTLIPEAPWRLSSLLSYLEKRLESRGHCLIAVAEGAEALEVTEERRALMQAKTVQQSPTTTAQTPAVAVADVPAPSASQPAAAAAPAPAPAAAPLAGIKRDESGEPCFLCCRPDV